MEVVGLLFVTIMMRCKILGNSVSRIYFVCMYAQVFSGVHTKIHTHTY